MPTQWLWRPIGHTLILILWLVTIAAFAAGPAKASGGKAALIIGNGAYKHAPALPNPSNDAADIAVTLRGLGFEVVEGINLDRNGMADAIGRFARLLVKAETALFFYAGHGLQVNGKNYLVPIDAKLDHPSDLKFQAIDLDGLIEDMDARKGVNLIFLDACRDNPFTRSLTRAMGASRSSAVGSGLAGTQANVGTLIAFATQPNNVAADGTGRNSPFTTALMKHIATPGLEVRAMLTRVRNDVVGLTGGKQVPWDHSSLLGDVFLKPAPKAPDSGAPVAGGAGDGNPEVAFWQTIAGSREAADFEAYLKKYPTGIFADLAKLRIAALNKPTAPAHGVPAAATVTAPVAAAVPVNLGLRALVPAMPEAYTSEIAVRADESLIATASSEGDIRLWDAHQKSLRAVLRLHSKYIKKMEFTPDGRYLVTYGSDGKLAVWDAASGRLDRSVDAKRQYANSMDVAENGAYVATLADNQIVIWSLPELRQIDTIGAKDSSDFVALSADGSIVVADDWQNAIKQAMVYDRMQKRVIQRFTRGSNLYPSRVHMIPGSQRMVLSWSDGLLQGIDYMTGRTAWERREIKKYPQFAISADGQFGVTNLWREVAVWDTLRGDLVHRLEGSFGSMAVTRERIWSTGSPFRTFDLKTGTREPAWPLARETIYNSMFVENGGKVVFHAGNRIGRFDLAAAKVDALVDGLEGALVRAGDGYSVVSREKVVTLDGRSLQPVAEHSLKPSIGVQDFVSRVANGAKHAIVSRSVGDKYEYELFDVAGKRTIAKLGEKSTCQIFSPAGDRLVHQSADNKLDYRDLTGKILRTITINYREKYEYMSQCDMTPDGKELVVVSGKGHFYIIDLASGKTARTYQVGTEYFYSLLVLPDGKTALVNQKDELFLVDLAGGRVVTRYGKGKYIRAVSPDGRLFVQGYPDLAVQRVDNGDIVATVQVFADGSHAVRTRSGYSGSPGVERNFVLDAGDRVLPVTERFAGDHRKADLAAEVARALK